MDKVTLLRLFWGLGFLLHLSAALNVMALFRFVWRKQATTRAFAMRASLSVFSTITVIFLLEFFFSYAMIQSDGLGQTLSSQLWFRKYWKPINAEGFRDDEKGGGLNKRVVFIVGDSFVAGHGVRRIEERFPNILGRKLGDEWEHVVIAQNGWQTGDQLVAMKAYEAKPDVIVLSYFINDVEGAAQSLGVGIPQYFVPPGPMARVFVDNSFFINWIYWRIFRRSMGDEYWEYLRHCFANPEVWALHLTELQAFHDYAESMSADLHVVVWPHLRRIEESKEFTDRIVSFFQQREVPVLDLADHFTGRSGAELVVNHLDAHPNPATHAEVANLLHEMVLVEKGEKGTEQE